MPDDEAMRYAPPTAEPHADVPAPVAPFNPLTNRESDIARLLADGLTNREIATRLVISQRTADTLVQNILNKLGFNNHAQIAANTNR